ncbi:MAG TPA: YtxH domain-containing protein [Chitinophagaceae bacterium]|nr:YtxH domain-containing protein [Chitinophagaceae bacterium]
MSKFLTGFAAGLVVGILFAPDKGSETRQKLADRANDLKDQFNDFIDSLGEKAEDLAEKADDMANKVKPEYQ